MVCWLTKTNNKLASITYIHIVLNEAVLEVKEFI